MQRTEKDFLEIRWFENRFLPRVGPHSCQISAPGSPKNGPTNLKHDFGKSFKNNEFLFCLSHFCFFGTPIIVLARFRPLSSIPKDGTPPGRSRVPGCALALPPPKKVHSARGLIAAALGGRQRGVCHGGAKNYGVLDFFRASFGSFCASPGPGVAGNGFYAKKHDRLRGRC